MHHWFNVISHIALPLALTHRFKVLYWPKHPFKLLYWSIYSLNYIYLSNHSNVKTLIGWASEMHVFLAKQIQSNIEKIERERRDLRRQRRERRDPSHRKASPRRLAALILVAPWWFRSTWYFFFFLSFIPLAIHEIANL